MLTWQHHIYLKHRVPEYHTLTQFWLVWVGVWHFFLESQHSQIAVFEVNCELFFTSLECWQCGQTIVGALERLQIFILAEGLKMEIFSNYHSTVLYQASTWLYHTLPLLYLTLGWLYYTLAVLDFTTCYHGFTWLYVTLLHTIIRLYLTLFDSSMHHHCSTWL